MLPNLNKKKSNNAYILDYILQFHFDLPQVLRAEFSLKRFFLGVLVWLVLLAVLIASFILKSLSQFSLAPKLKANIFRN